MIKIEIDGKEVSVPKGSSVMDAARQVGVYIPHFCYHKKLSIAANCRMCLVEVEKAPKPLPACATPVTEGMKVSTHSQQAIKAQKGVMEFLLINHPLDCPICDQGGECQLQDLAVGYGASESRYQEPKRVVTNKNLGPLISTDMTRCIHCTRCVRFGQEIAGIMELGIAGRGEHSEILAFVGKTVDSELSGNVIDLCPVGALVSKPFRYSARTWELSRRKSISPHCGLGSNLIVQVKNDRVMRVLPRENEEINECWLSDKDRFSYEGLNSDDRLTVPMIKQNGQWQNCSWEEALTRTVEGIRDAVAKHGKTKLGALASPHSTLEELYLLQKLIRGLGSQNIDHRLRQSDFRVDSLLQGIPWLGMPIAEVSGLRSFLIIGSTLRKDHPLLAHRVRQAVRRGAQLNLVNPVDDDLLTKIENRAIVAPSAMLEILVQILKAASTIKGVSIVENLSQTSEQVKLTDVAQAIATSLIENAPAAIFLGNMAQHHPLYTDMFGVAQAIADVTGARLGILGEAANSVGGYVANAIPWNGISGFKASGENTGLNAAEILRLDPNNGEAACAALLLLNLEPELDSYDSLQAKKTLDKTAFVVSLSSYKGNIPDYADIMLPIAPFTETSGTFINTEGRVQSFKAVVNPLGEARPAWKVLRVLGNLLQLDGFGFNSSEEVLMEIIPAERHICNELNNKLSAYAIDLPQSLTAMERVGEVPIYQTDPIVRRAPALQATQDARRPLAFAPSALLKKIGVEAGQSVKITQGEGTAILPIFADDNLPGNCLRVASGCRSTVFLGGMFGEITLEKI